jgi:hypothetical protein
MQLEFIPVDSFYFAITLCLRTLEEFEDPALVAQVHTQLGQALGQSSTVAAAQQNTFNYTFKVLDYDNSPSPQLVVSILDWQDKLRLSSDYGWTLNQERKPERTEKFALRDQFCADRNG